MQLVLATSNPHKVREFLPLLKTLPGLEILSLKDFPKYIPPQETGVTFKENAILKAEYAARALKMWVLSDDSGLVVSALQGEPGVYSARYSGLPASDAKNRLKLLQKMEGLHAEQRAAYFECCLVLANGEGMYKCVTGLCEGTIIAEQRGNKGFGYDSLFVRHDLAKTFAELDEDVKNRISHRRKAFDKMLQTLERLVNKETQKIISN